MSAASGAAAAPAESPAVPLFVAPMVAMAAFMEVLDLSIANVALPHIAGNLSVTQNQATWVLTSYLVANAIVLPMSGWLSAVLGRKRFYMMCIAGFGLSSLLCGMAPNLPMLIIFRTLQGLTGGGLQPSSQAILADSFPPAKRGMAFAAYGMAVVFAPAIGPTLGGWITDNFTWHWIFLINVPVSLLLFSLTQVLISDPEHVVAAREARRSRGIRLDYLGFALLALGLGGLQLMLDKGQEEDWFASHMITAAAVVAVVCLTTFVVREWYSEDPLVDLRLLRRPNFAIANVLMFMLGFILLGSTALLPLFVQSLLGYTAMDAGLVISPGGFLIMFMMPVVGRLVAKVDNRYLIAFGLCVGAIGLFLASRFTLTVDYWTIAGARAVQAVGLAFLFIPINSVAYVGIPPERNNYASALINLSRNLGGSVGIALLVTLLARNAQENRVHLVAHVSAYDHPYREVLSRLTGHLVAGGANAMEATKVATATLAGIVQQQAQLLAFLHDFRLLGAVFLVLLPLLFLMRLPKTPMGGGPGGGH